MGSLRRRGRVWWMRYYRNGKRYEESARTTKQKKAEHLLNLREGAIAKGEPVTPALSRVTFDDAAKDLEREYEQNGRKSIDAPRRRFRLHVTPYFTGWRLASITTSDVRAYIEQRREGDKEKKIPPASNATINRELAALKRMFRFAQQAGRVLAVPHIPMLKEDNVRTGFFDRPMFEAVRDLLPAAVQPVATFAYLTGWRIPSEVLTLEWRQVDLAAGIVCLAPGATKNGEGRVFPCSALPELQTLLRELRTATEAEERRLEKIIPNVFHRHGKAIRSFIRSWRAACTAAGCPGRIPHDFRRTAVRNLVRAGVPERVAMQLTGHKTRSVFERYNIVAEGDSREGVAKLAASVPGTKQGQSAESATVHAIQARL